MAAEDTVNKIGNNFTNAAKTIARTGWNWGLPIAAVCLGAGIIFAPGTAEATSYIFGKMASGASTIGSGALDAAQWVGAKAGTLAGSEQIIAGTTGAAGGGATGAAAGAAAVNGTTTLGSVAAAPALD